MTENQIKVNNIEELISKAREYIASQGGSEKVRIGETSTSSGYYTYTKDKGLVQTSKGGVKVELNGQNDSSINFFLESEGEEEMKGGNGVGKISPKLLKKVLAELNKIIPDTRPTPSPNKSPNGKDNPQPYSFNALAIPCSNLKEVKEHIKKYYQKNKIAIAQNPDFSHWININEISLYSSHSEVNKNGETVTSGPYNTATIVLHGHDRVEDEKVVNQQINLLLKVKTDSEEWSKEDFDISWPEKQLKNYWNSLVGKKEEKKNIPPKSPDKNNQSEIEKLRQEINELENNPSTNNSEIAKKELTEKRKRFNELEKGNNNTSNKPNNNNLVVYLSMGGITIILLGIIIVLGSRQRKKSKK